MTCALALVVVKLLRDERLRSDARVIALTEMADTAVGTIPAAREEPIAPRPAKRAPRAPAAVSLDEYELDTGSGSRASYGTDTYEPDQIGAAPGGDLFAVQEPRSAWPRRVGVAVAVALVVLAVGLGIRSLPDDNQTTADPRAIATASAGTQSGLLELLTLEHVQEANALTIKGLVQNPRDGSPLSKIAATAFLFGADGAFLASGRAALDFTMLRPGDESAFVINVPVAARVARYRVSFRSEDGRVIGHVDRRSAVPIAQNHGS
jgi:hypothetical protein